VISLKYKKICTVVNPDSDQAKSLSMNIANEYSDHSWQIIENFDFSNVEKMDLVIAIGGDGTLLRAVSLSLKFDVPVLGINMGTVGFMTEIEGENAIDELNFYLTETVRTEVRSLLEVELNFKKDPVVYKALNDIVIARGSSVSMIETITEIDGVHLATYRGDGIVVTTATGSTGYSLALGGPVIDPKSNDYYIKPIATHMSQFGGVIVNSESVCEITISSRKDALISIDGFIEHKISNGDKIILKISESKAKFLRKNPSHFYWSTITEKLGIRKGKVQ
jgi:NAD+ kinase|tara:strand:- start:25763 stop:26599 length:837 start_codon:yes stop_codon:yes gene_type:complete